MPKNAEYLILAYGITMAAIIIYSTQVLLKLRSIKKKLSVKLGNNKNES